MKVYRIPIFLTKYANFFWKAARHACTTTSLSACPLATKSHCFSMLERTRGKTCMYVCIYVCMYVRKSVVAIHTYIHIHTHTRSCTPTRSACMYV